MSVTLLSHILDSNTPSYGNRDKVEIKSNSSIAAGDTANSLSWNFSTNHIGTHIDVPRHFYEEGKTITDLSPKIWLFDYVSIVDIPCKEAKLITTEDLKDCIINPRTDLLLIRTGYEHKRKDDSYWQAYPSIASEACTWLRNQFPNLRGVGFDFISLTSPQFKDEGKKAHQIFLDQSSGNFILIIEDMKLDHLSFIPEQVIIAPLMVNKADGSPATVFAM